MSGQLMLSLVIACLYSATTLCSAQEPLILEVESSVETLTLRPLTDLEKFELRLPVEVGEKNSSIASVLSTHLSIGDLLGWSTQGLEKEIRIESSYIPIFQKALRDRLDARNEHLILWKDASRGSKSSRTELEAKANANFITAEKKAERKLSDQVEEILPPGIQQDLKRVLLRDHYPKVAGAEILCQYLALNEDQKLGFDRAYKLYLANPQKPEEYIPALFKAEKSLKKEQFELFNKAIGRIPLDMTIDSYFESLSEKERDEKCKMFPVYRTLKDKEL